MSDSNPPSPPAPDQPPPGPPKKKRHPILLGCAGAVLVVLIIAIVATVANSGGSKKPQANATQGHTTSPTAIRKSPPKPSSKPVVKPTAASAPNSVTLSVWGNDGGNGTQISENTDTSNASVTAEINGGSATAPAWSAPLTFNANQEYYAVTAQMQGTGAISCSVTMVDNGKTYTKQGSGSGQYEICSAQLNHGVFGGWD